MPLSPDAIYLNLAAAITALLYMLGLTLRVYATSPNARGMGASLIDHSFKIAVFVAGIASLTSFVDFVKSIIVQQFPGEVQLQESLKGVGEHYIGNFNTSWSILLGIAAFGALIAFAPIVGPALSITVATAVTPLVFMFTFVMIGSLGLGVFYFLVDNYIVAIMGIGIVLISTKFLQGAGSWLLAFAIVVYVAAPLVPAVANVLMSEVCKECKIPTQEELKSLTELESSLNNANTNVCGEEVGEFDTCSQAYNSTANPISAGSITGFYQQKFDWTKLSFAHVVASLFVFGIVSATIAGFSKALGGAANGLSVY